MRSTSRRLVTALVVVALLGTAPANVAAQETAGSLLLNQGTSMVGEVTVDGERYLVYQYDNVFPYASGISVYRDGEQVTSSARVHDALAALARRRAAAELGTEELQALRTVRRDARVLANESGAAADALANATAYADHLKDVQVQGTTAWNATVDAAPAAAEFNRSAAELAPSLRRTERYARWVVSNTTILIDMLEQRRNGTEVDSRRLYERYATTMDAIDRLSDQEFDVDGLSDLPRLSEQAAANASHVPERGDEIARRFTALADETARASNRTTAAFESLDDAAGFGAPLRTARSVAETQTSVWMERWETRRHAPRDIYGTLLGVPVALALGLAYVRRRP